MLQHDKAGEPEERHQHFGAADPECIEELGNQQHYGEGAQCRIGRELKLTGGVEGDQTQQERAGDDGDKSRGQDAYAEQADGSALGEDIQAVVDDGVLVVPVHATKEVAVDVAVMTEEVALLCEPRFVDLQGTVGNARNEEGEQGGQEAGGGEAGATQPRKLSSALARLTWRRRLSAFSLIWRTRSRVMPSRLPISSRVIGSGPSRPK